MNTAESLLRGQTFKSHGSFISSILVLLVLAAFAIIFRFNGLYGQDAHEYLRLNRALINYYLSGLPLPHSYFPILFPFFASLLTMISFPGIIAMQVISMTALIFSFIYLGKLIILVHKDQKNLHLFLFCFFFLSPYVFRFGVLSMSDMLCMFFVTASVFHSLRWLEASKNPDAFFALLFSSAAVSTRYAAAPIILFPVLITLYFLIRKRKFLWCFISLVGGCLPLLPDLILRKRLLFFDLSKGNLPIDYASNAYSWSVLNFFRNSFQNPDGYQHYDYWNFASVTFNIIHPAFLFAGLLFLLFLRKQDFQSLASKLLVAIVVTYGLFIAGLHYQNNRYLLQTFPFVLVILYPAYERIIAKYLQKKNYQAIVFLLIIAIQVTFIWFSFQKIYLLNKTEREIADSLKPYSTQPLYTCSINGALASYEVSNPIADLYNERVSTIATNSLLLFNYNEFSQHFKDSNPMLNWNFIKEHYTLVPLRSYPFGWQLYSISEKKPRDSGELAQ